MSDGAADVPSAEMSVTEPSRPPIVAIGASAGGLEPIEQFFEALPDDTGAAYVIVQHLSPDFRSMMPEILNRHSNLGIRVIEHDMLVEPNVIYLNPPRSTLALHDERFQISEPTSSSVLTLPINDFLFSLAGARRNEAIAVILSGTGSDGAMGFRAVAAAGGMVLAQDPTTAKFESMPRSAIDGVPGALYAEPAQLAEMVASTLAGERPTMPADWREDDEGSLGPEVRILRLLQNRYGLDFGYYKPSTVGRRIERRSKLHRLGSLNDYARMLARDVEELEALYADLLIGVTAFFRDRDAFDRLTEEMEPLFSEALSRGDPVRIWAPGCASGEEAYSLAMLVCEHARAIGAEPRAKIFATDIHPRSLRTASRGVFGKDAMNGVPPELRERYFERVGDDWQASKAIRDLVVFSKHNIIKDPPFTRIDLVCCRNLLIYLDDEAQRKCVALFHFALRKKGFLFLGPSETLGALSDEFDEVDPRWRLFSKRRDVRLFEATRMLPMSARSQPPALAPAQPVQPLTQDMLRMEIGAGRRNMLRIYDAVLEKCVGTGLLVARDGDLMHVFGDAGRFLHFGAGAFSRRLSELVEEPFRPAILAGFDILRSAHSEGYTRTVRSPRAEAGAQFVKVAMTPIDVGGPPEDAPILVSLTPMEQLSNDASTSAIVATFGAAEAALDGAAQLDRIAELERELRFSEETLQTTTEELETSNEELQAMNEELQATNEELMASNEELQTVNEELHAVNEELYTVSSEHQAKIVDLNSVAGDLDHLLKSTSIGVLFLDAQKNIRSITPAVSSTFNVLERDIGRPIGHVTKRFELDGLDDAIDGVMRDGAVFETNIEVDARDYILRILPYQRDETVDGAVMTVVDISEIARANRNLSEFADIVSHDLKAPLRAIRKTAEWIGEDVGSDPSPELREHLVRMSEQTQKLSQMLSDLRDFSNLRVDESGPEPVDMRGLLSEIATIVSHDQLALEFESGAPILFAPKAALRLVFQNLLDNAVKHNDREQTVVRIGAEADGAFWRMTFVDNGPGVHPLYRDKVFLPFRKLKPSIETAGSGIGLALVRKTVEDHGGRIEVMDTPEGERGAGFAVWWPA